MCARTHARARSRTYAQMHSRTHTHIYTLTYIHTHASTHARTNTHTHIARTPLLTTCTFVYIWCIKYISTSSFTAEGLFGWGGVTVLFVARYFWIRHFSFLLSRTDVLHWLFGVTYWWPTLIVWCHVPVTYTDCLVSRTDDLHWLFGVTYWWPTLLVWCHVLMTYTDCLVSRTDDLHWLFGVMWWWPTSIIWCYILMTYQGRSSVHWHKTVHGHQTINVGHQYVTKTISVGHLYVTGGSWSVSTLTVWCHAVSRRESSIFVSCNDYEVHWRLCFM